MGTLRKHDNKGSNVGSSFESSPLPDFPTTMLTTRSIQLNGKQDSLVGVRPE